MKQIWGPSNRNSGRCQHPGLSFDAPEPTETPASRRAGFRGKSAVRGTGTSATDHYRTPDHFAALPTSIPFPLTTESPTTHYCTVQHHVPIDPYAERMPRADCSSNTIRDSISRVAPSLRGPRFAPALRHARRPCALTRGRPAVPRQPGTGRSRRTARRAALAPAVLR